MKKNYYLAGITIFFWSTISTVSKLLLATKSSFLVLCVSALFAFLFLFLRNLFGGKISGMKAWKAKDWGILFLIGLPGTFFYYVFLYGGTARLPASTAFIINYLWPIMSVVFAVLLLKEHMTVKKGFAFLLSFLGVAVTAGGEMTRLGGESLSGALLCVLCAVSYGLFTALNQKFSYDKSLATMVFFFFSFLGALGVCLLRKENFSLTLPELLGIGWNGIFVMGIATTLWAMALESGHTAKISNLAYITPFVSLIWNFIVLKEMPSIFAFAGLLLIIVGILIQCREPEKNKTVEDNHVLS